MRSRPGSRGGTVTAAQAGQPRANASPGGPARERGARAGAGKAPRRRGGDTRERLWRAAYAVFAEEGFGRAGVERVCVRVGFTRGAFSSNFTSLDELFLAMWEQRSATLREDLRAALDALADETFTDVRAAVTGLLAAVPLEEAWFRIKI